MTKKLLGSGGSITAATGARTGKGGNIRGEEDEVGQGKSEADCEKPHTSGKVLDGSRRSESDMADVRTTLNRPLIWNRTE